MSLSVNSASLRRRRRRRGKTYISTWENLVPLISVERYQG
jgi:hypothetical protein